MLRAWLPRISGRDQGLWGEGLMEAGDADEEPIAQTAGSRGGSQESEMHLPPAPLLRTGRLGPPLVSG